MHHLVQQHLVGQRAVAPAAATRLAARFGAEEDLHVAAGAGRPRSVCPIIRHSGVGVVGIAPLPAGLPGQITGNALGSGGSRVGRAFFRAPLATLTVHGSTGVLALPKASATMRLRAAIAIALVSRVALADYSISGGSDSGPGGAMPDKLDPYDVAALEKSVNDSAVRVSTIWISYLVFGLYLVTAAATVEHRQLLVNEPVKLPVLYIELPLWGFFFLAPILFVIFHAYVLVQVLLLGRTAAAYNHAVERAGLSPEEAGSLRQRLANTLFAQIFAGSPREREGLL